MCRTFPTCEPVEVVMRRLTSEIRSAADDLAGLEAHVASVIGKGTVEGMEHLQSLDRLGQQLRVLEAFLGAAKPCACGRIDIESALDRVWLESVRKRLGGGRSQPHEHVSAEPELW